MKWLGWKFRVVKRLLLTAFLGILLCAFLGPARTNTRIAKKVSQNAHGYQIDLISIQADQVWFRGIGEHDLVILKMRAYDTGSNVAGFVILTFKARQGQTVFFDKTQLPRLFGPYPVKGELKVYADLTVTHPKHFDNVRNVLQQLAQAEGVALVAARTATESPYVLVAEAILNQPKVSEVMGNFWTEELKLLGRIGCAGNDPLTCNFANANTLSLKELDQYTGHEFKLLSFHKGPQASTCFREIVYDPLQARILNN